MKRISKRSTKNTNALNIILKCVKIGEKKIYEFCIKKSMNTFEFTG